MKLKTSVAAVILAFSATGAWAGPTGTENSQSDLGTPDATAVQPSAGPVNEELQWKFLNGTGASDSKNRASQAAKSAEQGSSDQAAATEKAGAAGQAAASEQQSTGNQSAGSEQSGSEQAKSEESDGSSQAAMSEHDEDDKSAATEEQEGSDQTAKSEGQGEDQSAQLEDQDGNDQSADSDQPAADLKDKVVVIIPKEWKGSLPDLITALESSPDAKDIVIVQQGDPQASNEEPDDSYSASNKPIINQQ